MDPVDWARPGVKSSLGPLFFGGEAWANTAATNLWFVFSDLRDFRAAKTWWYVLRYLSIREYDTNYQLYYRTNKLWGTSLREYDTNYQLSYWQALIYLPTRVWNKKLLSSWQAQIYLPTRVWHKLPAILVTSSDVSHYEIMTQTTSYRVGKLWCDERMTQTARYRYDAMDATGKATRNLLLDPKWDRVPYFYWRK